MNKQDYEAYKQESTSSMDVVVYTLLGAVVFAIIALTWIFSSFQ